MLTMNDKIEIVHDCLVLRRPQNEIAKRYNLSTGYISNFLKKFKANRNLLREMIDKRDQEFAKVEAVQEVI